MTEWWTYRIADFKLFSARTYIRLFERYNHDVWPLHVFALIIGVLIIIFTIRSRPRVVAPLLAAVWIWVAYAFLWKRFATIQTAATWFAIAFVIQALLILWRLSRPALPRVRAVGVAVAMFAVAIEPLVHWMAGRIEVFGITPDPTVVATMGIALALGSRVLLAIPLLWCAVTGATLWELHTLDALTVPIIGAFVLLLSMKVPK